MAIQSTVYDVLDSDCMIAATFATITEARDYVVATQEGFAAERESDYLEGARVRMAIRERDTAQNPDGELVRDTKGAIIGLVSQH